MITPYYGQNKNQDPRPFMAIYCVALSPSVAKFSLTNKLKPFACLAIELQCVPLYKLCLIIHPQKDSANARLYQNGSITPLSQPVYS